MQSYIKIIETLLSHSYGYAVIFPQSETEYAFFTGISELVNYVEPLSFIPVAIFLCAYVVYWIEVTCNRRIILLYNLSKSMKQYVTKQLSK